MKILREILSSYAKIVILLFITVLVVRIFNGTKKDKREKVPDNQLTMREVGEAYSDWGKSPTGSAKYLDGNTVLVSIFLEDSSADWTYADRKIVYDNLSVACDYLKEEGKYYGKDVNLVYDFNKYKDLEYHMEYNQYLNPEDIYISEDDVENSKYSKFFDDANEFICNEIPIEDIMKNHNVNSIGFLVFVDDDANNAATYSYYEGGVYNHYEEMAFISIRWTSGNRDVNPDTYAHEILHLFGARDLYTTNRLQGVTKDFVMYAEKEFPTDIMLGHASDNVTREDGVDAQITKLTAYFLGWTNYIAELEKFPSVKMSKPAVFSVVKDNYGDYSEYKCTTRRRTENMEDNKIVEIFLIVYIVVLLIRMFILDSKKNKMDNEVKNDNF